MSATDVGWYPSVAKRSVAYEMIWARRSLPREVRRRAGTAPTVVAVLTDRSRVRSEHWSRPVHGAVTRRTNWARGPSVGSLTVSIHVLRVWLPDRPGALGAVATRIGAVRGDVIGIDIIE